MRFRVSWLLVMLLAACGGGGDTWTRCIDSQEGEAGAAAVPGLEVELGTVDPVIPVAAQDQTLLIYELSILNSSDAQVELVRVGAMSVQHILGHSSIQVTFDVYGGLFEADLDSVADRLEASFQEAGADSLRTGGALTRLGKTA